MRDSGSKHSLRKSTIKSCPFTDRLLVFQYFRTRTMSLNVKIKIMTLKILTHLAHA